MIFWNCKKLLEACVNAGLINTVPEGEYAGQLLIYRQAGKDPKYPEGWYAQDIEDAAQELMKDRAGQKFLLQKLREKGIEPEFIDEVQHHRELEGLSKFCEALNKLPQWQA